MRSRRAASTCKDFSAPSRTRTDVEALIALLGSRFTAETRHCSSHRLSATVGRLWAPNRLSRCSVRRVAASRRLQDGASSWPVRAAPGRAYTMRVMSFWFHNRVEMHPHVRFGAEVQQIELAAEPEGITVTLGVVNPVADPTIAKSGELLLQGRGFGTYDAALAAGHLWRHNLMAAFAKLGIPIDLGADDHVSPHEFIQEVEPPELFQPFGVQVGDRIVIDSDTPQLLVFAGEPHPRILYARLGEATLTVQGEVALIEQLASIRAAQSAPPSEQLKLAYQLVQSHLRDPSSEAGFLELVTALEALAPDERKSPDVIERIEKLGQVVVSWRTEGQIPADTAEVLGNILREGKKQSIRQSIVKLVNRLDGTYDGLSPKKFADNVYQIRSKLVHGAAGDNRPTREDMNPSELRRLVLDLLDVPLE